MEAQGVVVCRVVQGEGCPTPLALGSSVGLENLKNWVSHPTGTCTRSQDMRQERREERRQQSLPTRRGTAVFPGAGSAIRWTSFDVGVVGLCWQILELLAMQTHLSYDSQHDRVYARSLSITYALRSTLQLVETLISRADPCFALRSFERSTSDVRRRSDVVGGCVAHCVSRTHRPASRFPGLRKITMALPGHFTGRAGPWSIGHRLA